ncbi:MAG TPA: 2-dehydropantoate 2-reductase [Ktedonobacteraceae bacterium]
MDLEVDVIGIGGAGGFLASSLYRGGIRPRIISRGAALRQLREVGLTIISDDKRSIYCPINCSALDDVQQFAPILLLTTKSYDIPALMEEIAPRITPETLVITVQNGFAAYDTAGSVIGSERAVMGVLYVGAHIVSPGVIDLKPGVAQLFLPNTHQATLGLLVDSLEAAGVEAALVDDIERRMWMKQLFLVPFAIINAEMRQPIGKVREDEAARKRWSGIAIEVAQIAQACGITLPADPAAASLAVAERFDPQADSSFARDIWANRPHEAEALFGPLLSRARIHQVQCPLLQQAFDYYVRT